MEKIRVKLKITGVVQGVFYRITAKENADKIQVYGWVRNMRDRSVEAEIEGERDKVDEFIKLCWKGSTHCKVDNIDINYLKFKSEFNRFTIR